MPLFHKLIGFGLQNMNEGYLDAADRYMRLGFKGSGAVPNELGSA